MQNQIPRVPIRVRQVAPVGRNRITVRLWASPDKPGRGLLRLSAYTHGREAAAGLGYGVLLVREITHQPLQGLAGLGVARFALAAGQLEQRLRGHFVVAGVFVHDALVELDGFGQIAFGSLFDERLLEQVVGVLSRGRGGREHRERQEQRRYQLHCDPPVPTVAAKGKGAVIRACGARNLSPKSLSGECWPLMEPTCTPLPAWSAGAPGWRDRARSWRAGWRCAYPRFAWSDSRPAPRPGRGVPAAGRL